MKLAVDVGGTFTDLVLYDEKTGNVSIVKCPSTPEGFERGVLKAVDEAAAEREGREVVFIHGSTVVINHLLERKGARTALVTTKGFRDNLDIQRTNRPDLYNLRYRKPKPFVERADRYEVDERIGADGAVVRPLDPAEIGRIAERVRAGGYEAVAVAFINAYKNPVHEREAARLLKEMLPGVYVTCSSNVALWREYERTNTAVSSAYVGPAVHSYLGKLEDGLRERGIGGEKELQPTMMLSNGGRTTFDEARSWPIDLVESGPAAGITGACALGERTGKRDFIALDVGGTTAKAGLVENGKPMRLQEYTLEPGSRSAGYPLLVPTVDIVEVGAGGGSIVRVTEDGAIRVGPDSAGANPGPACYGRGGRLPAVTDANFLAGRLPETLASGLKLDRAAAERAFEPIARQLGIPLEDVVRGALRVAESKMAQVLRLATVARGKDPREYDLIAYGGSAPLHAAEMARDLRLRSVLIPPNAGVFSAWGMLHAPFLADAMRTVWVSWPEGRERIERETEELVAEAQAKFAAMGLTARSFEKNAEVRYQGQARSITVDASDLDRVAEAFAAAHKEKFGFTMDAPLEITGIHVVASDAEAAADAGTGSGGTDAGADEEARTAASPVPAGRRRVLASDGWHEAAVYRRGDLKPGDRIDGPAVVEEHTTTTYVPPDAKLAVDRFANLVLTFGKEEG
ncbi:hydantoinase/oxoprolinase family protein [Cohnella thermotolerans]|uniref:hydantoinase/oxoprolinase family protein n=1 Tax=Cohnella thermotolerans TaxID=329858 RepID=UPI00047D982A|nr:hydantoinase/oxoprolinase family protein [Cohnella thermotolerans]